jgi:hypothetical protein
MKFDDGDPTNALNDFSRNQVEMHSSQGIEQLKFKLNNEQKSET